MMKLTLWHENFNYDIVKSVWLIHMTYFYSSIWPHGIRHLCNHEAKKSDADPETRHNNTEETVLLLL